MKNIRRESTLRTSFKLIRDALHVKMTCVGDPHMALAKMNDDYLRYVLSNQKTK